MSYREKKYILFVDIYIISIRVSASLYDLIVQTVETNFDSCSRSRVMRKRLLKDVFVKK